tara:strand:- start:8 stop:1555 length:1548 start_codon:yes stop_codon:yes gene_type:complete
MATGFDPNGIRAAPAKANAAPSVSKNAAVGLIDALNAYELQLCSPQPGQSEGTFLKPNTYSIEFAPAAIGNSLVTKPGKPNKAKTPMQQSTTPSAQLNPASNSADYASRTFGYAAGTSIVSILDEIMKNSSFISDQAAYIVVEKTNKTVPQTPLGNLVWYKISVVATPMSYDTKRLDYAYNIKYVISAYAINTMLSQYFPLGKMRGVHKSYKYWFTGQNTQVLRFEQDFNKAYLTTFTNPDVSTNQKEQQARFSRETQGVQFQAASGSSSSQGAEGLANSIGASAADYLYSYADIANITMSILGDPAWLQQGELAYGINSATFNFSPFNLDGGINFDAEEIVFDFQWNTVTDYAVNTTGLASPVMTGNKNTQIYNYKTVSVTSKFSQGKFEQELKGALIQLYDQTPVIAPIETTATFEIPSSGVRGRGVSQSPALPSIDGGENAAGADPAISRNTTRITDADTSSVDSGPSSVVVSTPPPGWPAGVAYPDAPQIPVNEPYRVSISGTSTSLNRDE